MSEAAAERLHNTPAIARNSYIHPNVVALTETDPEARRALFDDAPVRSGLKQAEAVLLKLLER